MCGHGDGLDSEEEAVPRAIRQTGKRCGVKQWRDPKKEGAPDDGMGR